MLEASWIAFYLILHLLVSVFILPLLLAVGKRWPHPSMDAATLELRGNYRCGVAAAVIAAVGD